MQPLRMCFGMPVTEWQNEQNRLRPELSLRNLQGCRHPVFANCFAGNGESFAASGILFQSRVGPAQAVVPFAKNCAWGVCAHDIIPHLKLVLGDIEARVDWGYAPDYVDAMFPHPAISGGERLCRGVGGGCIRCANFAEIAFDAVGLDWQRPRATGSGALKEGCSAVPGRFGQAASRDRMVAQHRLQKRLCPTSFEKQK